MNPSQRQIDLARSMVSADSKQEDKKEVLVRLLRRLEDDGLHDIANDIRDLINNKERVMETRENSLVPLIHRFYSGKGHSVCIIEFEDVKGYVYWPPYEGRYLDSQQKRDGDELHKVFGSCYHPYHNDGRVGDARAQAEAWGCTKYTVDEIVELYHNALSKYHERCGVFWERDIDMRLMGMHADNTFSVIGAKEGEELPDWADNESIQLGDRPC